MEFRVFPAGFNIVPLKLNQPDGSTVDAVQVTILDVTQQPVHITFAGQDWELFQRGATILARAFSRERDGADVGEAAAAEVSEVVLRDAEVLRVKPNEFLLIKLTWIGEEYVEVAESFVADLVAAGLERGRFVIVNGDGIELAVVEQKP